MTWTRAVFFKGGLRLFLHVCVFGNAARMGTLIKIFIRYKMQVFCGPNLQSIWKMAQFYSLFQSVRTRFLFRQDIFNQNLF